MSKTIVNLLTSVIAGEVEEILDSYDDHPYQQAFAIPEMRQELIAYVLSYFPGNYTLLDEARAPVSQPAMPPLSPQERNAIRQKVHEGIQCLLDRHAGSISHHLPETDQPGLAPSHWFG